MPTSVFIVPHTHWDREWYEPAARFRQRLVPVVDEVLDLLASNRLPAFLLDGQLAVVDDYLAIRPGRRADVERLVRAGTLLIGPWYVLSDELLCDDETQVRNLLTGRRLAQSLGGWLALGYSPDAFGHPAALPTILAGFGITTAIVWRGYGGEPGQDKDLFRWVGPDGSSVLAHHLPPDGYEFGSALPADPRAARERWERIAGTLGPRAGAPAWLLLSGADHHAAQTDLPQAVAELRKAARGIDISIASPQAYFASLPAENDLSDVHGELRFSYRYTWTLQGVHSTRCGLKQVLAESAALLTRWVEPQTALAPSVGQGRNALVDAAWQDHLRSCAHDSIGGCSADEIALDMHSRARGAVTQARGLLVDALHDRLGQDRARARAAGESWRPALAVVNPSPYGRSGVVETAVSVFEEDVVVGRAHPAGVPRAPARFPGLAGPDGKELPVQILAEYEGYDRLDSPRHYPDQDRVRVYRVAVVVPEVPPLGVLRLDARKGTRTERSGPHVRAGDGRLIGDDMTVSAGGFGGFAVETGGARWDALGVLEDQRDDGDTYSFQPASDRPLAAKWSPARVVWRGPLTGALARDFTVGRRARGTVFARIDAGSSLVRFGVDGVNLEGGHRLRIRFPSPDHPAARVSVADMPFGPTERERRDYNLDEYPREWPVMTAPMHRYVSAGGMTVFARGLFEYELTRDGAIAVTLLRSVSDLSRGDLRARPGHAGWPVPTPLARERGPFRRELAWAAASPGAGGSPGAWTEIERLADEFHAPLAGLMMRYAIDMPHRIVGPRLEGLGLAFKTLKRAEDGNGLIVRCVNLTRGSCPGAWIWPSPVTAAFRSRLDESKLVPIPLADGGRYVAFTARSREVVTIRVEP